MAPTAETARSLFVYDAESGGLTWRNDRVSLLKGGNAIVRAKAGDIAGGMRPDGRRAVPINGRLYLSYRVAWLIVHGEWPVKHLDHARGLQAGDGLGNLRPANDTENGRNRGPQKNNKSGFKGVSWASREGKWHARIKAEGQYKSLGYFDSAELAASAYAAAATKYHGEFARTSWAS